MKRPPRPSRESTLNALLTRSKRAHLRLRTTFVQQGTHGEPTPGPLAALLHRGDQRALDLYLLVNLLASGTGGEAHDVALPSQVWARALGIDVQRSASSISKVWRRLEAERLIERGRAGALARATLLREDGSGEPYTPPTGSDGDRYLRLPVSYWDTEERWYERLTLPAKTMLLVLLSLRAGAILPYERAPEWYGVSADSAERGLRQLNEEGLLAVKKTFKESPLSAAGYTEERHYWLQAPFDTAARGRSQATKKSTRRRRRKAES